MGKNLFVCKNCGIEYLSKKQNSKYCSIQCRREYLNFTCLCDYCGKEFSVMKNKIDAIKNGKRKNIFCSKECATNFQKNSVVKNCKNCNNEFTVINAFKDIQKYCSQKCYIEYKNNNSKKLIKICPQCGKIFYTYHKEQINCSKDCSGMSMRNRVDCICDNCGKSFERIKSEVIKNNKHFCSFDCKLEYVKWVPEDISVYSENVYEWLRKYIRDHLSSWRNRVIKQLGNKCCLTGETTGLEVHHCRGFNVMMKETIDKLNFEIKTSFLDYSNQELETLLSAFLEIQNKYKEYVCISADVHKLFHKNFGYGNNTIDQWNVFVWRYKNGFYTQTI